LLLDKNLISYDHLIANDNGLWFILLNLMGDNSRGRIMQLILHTLSNNTNMMTSQNAKKEYAYEIMIKNKVSYIVITSFV
jgi:hypothetical protein